MLNLGYAIENELQRLPGAAFIEVSWTPTSTSTAPALQRLPGAAFIEVFSPAMSGGRTDGCSAFPALPSLRCRQRRARGDSCAALKRLPGAAFIEAADFLLPSSLLTRRGHREREMVRSSQRPRRSSTHWPAQGSGSSPISGERAREPRSQPSRRPLMCHHAVAPHSLDRVRRGRLP